MKKIKFIILCVLISIMIVLAVIIVKSYKSDFNNVNIVIGKSQIYSEKELREAIELIIQQFKHDKFWRQCTLLELCYDEEKSLSYSGHNTDNEDKIVIFSSFHVNSLSDGSLQENETYNNWQWILVRKNNGEWKLENWGYGKIDK